MQLVFGKKCKHADRAREEWGGEAFVGGGNGHVPGICCRFKSVRRCGTVFFKSTACAASAKALSARQAGLGLGYMPFSLSRLTPSSIMAKPDASSKKKRSSFGLSA